MSIPFRYVGRIDDPNTITGQMGFSSFDGLFDAAVYQEYFTPVPEAAVREIPPEEALILKRHELGRKFESEYKALIADVPLQVRQQIMELRRLADDALVVGDVEQAEAVITGFVIPDELPSALKTKMTKVKNALVAGIQA